MKKLLLIGYLFWVHPLASQTIHVGAKHFNEGYILSEIISQLLESEGYTVKRHYNLGGTLVCFEALRNRAIDVYPEYSGTLTAEILKDPNMAYEAMNAALQDRYGIAVAAPYGFNNSYALVCTRDFSERNKILSIADLKNHPELKIGMSYEFLKREDGWENLANKYALPQNAVGLEHGLAYQALTETKIDITDAYSTDGEISKYGLVVLKDDQHFFPAYQATSLYQKNLDARAKKILSRLDGQIDEQTMQAMNAEVLYQKKTFAQVAASFLSTKLKISSQSTKTNSVATEVLAKMGTHLLLTFSALLAAILFAVPLGIWLYWKPRVANGILYFTGLLQTIPSIALLAIMIPVFGIGTWPAIVALFLYALLPILRNTLAGLRSVDPLVKKVADGIGMTRFQKLKWVELPLAMPMLLTGIRTAAVINVGTATLAAFIGAGGLGEFIVTGLALNNTSLILRGAIPAAVLAILIEIAFTFLEKAWVPKHLRGSK